ncbi:MAG: neutral zinc metallopeptidase [Pyrinomonadaceae bacterium]
MRWREGRQSQNVEDRRGISRGGVAIGGGLGGIVILIIALLLGADPRQLLEQMPTENPAPATQSSRQTNPEDEELRQFVGAVLAQTEDVWNDIFRQLGRQYQEPRGGEECTDKGSHTCPVCRSRLSLASEQGKAKLVALLQTADTSGG